MGSPPQYKDQEVGKFWDKISFTNCKWSKLNAPGTEIPVSHPFLGESLFSFPLSGVIDNWTLQYECQKGGNFLEQNQLNRLLMVQFECPGVRNPFDSIICNLYTVIWKEEERERRVSAAGPAGASSLITFGYIAR